MKLDLKRLKFLPIFSSELHGRNSLHSVRWARVITLKEMTPVAFRKQSGYKKTMGKIYELVAEADAENVGPQAIKKSCDLVDDAIETGNANQLFVADWPTSKLGKKRRRLR